MMHNRWGWVVVDFPHGEVTSLNTPLVVWGRYCGDPLDISANLIPSDKNGKPTGDPPIQGKLNICPHPYWCAVFRKGEEKVTPGYYIVQVLGRGKKNLIVTIPNPIAVDGARPKKVSIQYPLQSDDPLPTTFQAWGTTDKPPVQSGVLVPDNSGPPCSGTIIQQAQNSGDTWIIQFSNVTPGGYTLFVTDAGTDPATSDHLTVS